MKTTHRILILALLTSVSALGLRAQSGGSTGSGTSTANGTTTAPTTNPVPKGKGPAENASENAKAVHKVIADFQTQRDQLLAERKLLLEKLRTATEAERKTILEQLRLENEKRAEEERALGKQIREELKKLREERKSTGS